MRKLSINFLAGNKNWENTVFEIADIEDWSYDKAESHLIYLIKLAAKKAGLKYKDMIKNLDRLTPDKFKIFTDELLEVYNK